LELENERASANVGAFFLYIYYMITRKKKKCKECGNDSYIWSKGRCKKCASRSYKGIGPSKNVKEKIDLDTKFYEEIWSERPHYCEECDKGLGNKWERYMFSHILSKGSQPKLRHVKENINILCLECHQKWEFGDKKSMDIYPVNEQIIDILRQSIL
jgi:ribosomal protein L37E